MKTIRFNHLLIAACAALGAGAAAAHVVLPAGGATAGSDYEAAFRVGHACRDAKTTTGVTVQLPEGFTMTHAQPREGWTLKAGPREVSWQADSAQAGLPGAEHGPKADFIVRGKLTDKPGTLYFHVVQICDVGSSDWAQIPTGGSTEKLSWPAPHLDVLAPGIAPVDVRDAWVRPAVPGQSGTAAFMKLTAPSGLRLIGASTPAAGIAEVHQMSMDGGVMKMREVKGGLELPPRQMVELSPTGFHVMLMDLKQEIAAGTTVPITLLFADAKGAKSSLALNLPVGAPQGRASGSEHDHMYMEMK